VKPGVTVPIDRMSLKATNHTQMAQTLVSIYVHIIFSTKHRIDLIRPEVESGLFTSIGGIVNNNRSKLLAAGGTACHMHLLISLCKNLGLSELVGDIKRDSSFWMKTAEFGDPKFGWQDGYGAFSVGHTQIDAVKKYIENQKAHHASILFEDEFRYFLDKYAMEYDERFVWD